MLRRALLARTLSSACPRPALRHAYSAQVAYAQPPLYEHAGDASTPAGDLSGHESIPSSSMLLPASEIYSEAESLSSLSPNAAEMPKRTRTRVAKPAPEPGLEGMAEGKPKRGRKKKTDADGPSVDNVPKARKKRAPKEPKEKKEVKVLPPIEDSVLYQEAVKVSLPEESVYTVMEEIRSREGKPVDPFTMEVDEYRQEFHVLATRLLNRFSLRQLRTYLNDSGIDPSEWAKARKEDVAAMTIVKIFDWESPDEVEQKHKEDTDLIHRDFPVTPPEARLLMGKDAAELRQLSSRFHVHLNMHSSGQQLYFRGEGLKRSLDELEDHIDDLKQNMVVEDFHLPTNDNVPSHLVQRISQLSNTYMEVVKGTPDIVRIHAMSARAIEGAKRLAVHAASFPGHLAQIPLLSYLPSKEFPITPIPLSILPTSYSLYPFISATSLPWTISTSGAFRIRRVGEWLGHEAGEDIRMTGGLTGGKGSIATPTNEPRDVRSVLLDGFVENADAPIQVSATMGHLLFVSSSQGQRPTLVPPLTGSRAFPKIMNWMVERHARPHFVNGLPAPVTQTLSSQHEQVHRLTYRSASSSASSGGMEVKTHKVMTMDACVVNMDPVVEPDVDVVGKRAAEEPVGPVRDEDTEFSTSDASPIIDDLDVEPEIADDDWATSEPSRATESSTYVEDAKQAPNTSKQVIIEGRCVVGYERELDILMPDRPMDIRFVASQLNPVATAEMPPELASYLQSYQQWQSRSGEDAQGDEPSAPFKVVHNGEEYLLVSSVRGRKGRHTLNVKPNVSEFDYMDSTTPVSVQRVPVATESLTDVETELKTSICKVVCADHIDAGSWKTFLNHCDQLSSVVFQSNTNTLSPLFQDEHDQKFL